MGRKEFFREIDDLTRLRVLVVTDRGLVTRFMVQLEAFSKEKWTPVVRYDSYHGFAHIDILHPDRRQDKIRSVAKDLNESLNTAFADLLTNWEYYVSAYLKEQ
ncbi:MAG: hypothetical protein HYV00_04260 [Deltaproteobacteria bacterium]|nr:hypothetical protein [Deltaproteobacteria bacterium]